MFSFLRKKQAEQEPEPEPEPKGTPTVTVDAGHGTFNIQCHSSRVEDGRLMLYWHEMLAASFAAGHWYSYRSIEPKHADTPDETADAPQAEIVKP